MWSHRYHGIHDPASPELVLIQVFWPKSRGYKDCAGVLPSVFFLFFCVQEFFDLWPVLMGEVPPYDGPKTPDGRVRTHWLLHSFHSECWPACCWFCPSTKPQQEAVTAQPSVCASQCDEHCNELVTHCLLFSVFWRKSSSTNWSTTSYTAKKTSKSSRKSQHI